VNYSVAWSVIAQQQLAAIWLVAPDRNAVTRASHAIDLALAASPHAIGTLLFDTVYEFSLPPLAVEFEVIDDDMRVLVLAVWDTAAGRPTVGGN
jgi:plasmid stabilization system protein ParE